MTLLGEEVPAIESPVEPDLNFPPDAPTPGRETFIADGVIISGDLHGNGTILVEGIVEGEVRVAGSVTVHPSGLITGTVEADTIRVAGSVVGNIIASEHLQLERTGTIDGDVTCVSFVLEDGGRLNGRSRMV